MDEFYVPGEEKEFLISGERVFDIEEEGVIERPQDDFVIERPPSGNS